MAKTITIEFEENRYTLEYNRKAIERMEKDGFKATEMDNQPLLMSRLMFEGAFCMNHPKISNSLVHRMFDALENKLELVKTLGVMYSETFDTLFGEPKESEKNAKWTVAN